jgi:hypothetical protein
MRNKPNMCSLCSALIVLYIQWVGFGIYSIAIELSWTIDQFEQFSLRQFVCDSNLDWPKAVPKLRSFITVAQAALTQIEKELSIL